MVKPPEGQRYPPVYTLRKIHTIVIFNEKKYMLNSAFEPDLPSDTKITVNIKHQVCTMEINKFGGQ